MKEEDEASFVSSTCSCTSSGNNSSFNIVDVSLLDKADKMNVQVVPLQATVGVNMTTTLIPIISSSHEYSNSSSGCPGPNPMNSDDEGRVTEETSGSTSRSTSSTSVSATSTRDGEDNDVTNNRDISDNNEAVDASAVCCQHVELERESETLSESQITTTTSAVTKDNATRISIHVASDNVTNVCLDGDENDMSDEEEGGVGKQSSIRPHPSLLGEEALREDCNNYDAHTALKDPLSNHDMHYTEEYTCLSLASSTLDSSVATMSPTVVERILSANDEMKSDRAVAVAVAKQQDQPCKSIGTIDNARENISVAPTNLVFRGSSGSLGKQRQQAKVDTNDYDETLASILPQDVKDSNVSAIIPPALERCEQIQRMSTPGAFQCPGISQSMNEYLEYDDDDGHDRNITVASAATNTDTFSQQNEESDLEVGEAYATRPNTSSGTNSISDLSQHLAPVEATLVTNHEDDIPPPVSLILQVSDEVVIAEAMPQDYKVAQRNVVEKEAKRVRRIYGGVALLFLIVAVVVAIVSANLSNGGSNGGDSNEVVTHHATVFGGRTTCGRYRAGTLKLYCGGLTKVQNPNLAQIEIQYISANGKTKCIPVSSNSVHCDVEEIHDERHLDYIFAHSGIIFTCTRTGYVDDSKVAASVFFEDSYGSNCTDHDMNVTGHSQNDDGNIISPEALKYITLGHYCKVRISPGQYKGEVSNGTTDDDNSTIDSLDNPRRRRSQADIEGDVTNTSSPYSLVWSIEQNVIVDEGTLIRNGCETRNAGLLTVGSGIRGSTNDYCFLRNRTCTFHDGDGGDCNMQLDSLKATDSFSKCDSVLNDKAEVIRELSLLIENVMDEREELLSMIDAAAW